VPNNLVVAAGTFLQRRETYQDLISG